MKPYFIYLIRHGESEGNVDDSVYRSIPDWKVVLTQKGHEQAKRAAMVLHKEISKLNTELTHTPHLEVIPHRPKLMIYTSPWTRARQTCQHINVLFKTKVYEDPRLREQEWGNYETPELKKKIKMERKKFGTFFYRMPDGESGADVFDRVTTFIDTLYRDFAKVDYPMASVIVSHGLAIKTF